MSITIDFNHLYQDPDDGLTALGGNYPYSQTDKNTGGNVISEDGFTLSLPARGYYTYWDEYNDNPYYVGSTAVQPQGKTATASLTQADAGAFDLKSIQLADCCGDNTTMTVVGIRQYGPNVEMEIDVGPTLETTSFNSDWTDLLEVTFSQGDYLQIDNIVLCTNSPPVAKDDRFETSEDDVLSGVNVITNTNPNGPDFDPDDDALTVTGVNGDPANVGSVITLPSGATLQVVGSGDFVYNPNGAFDDLAPGETDQDIFTYTISDGQETGLEERNVPRFVSREFELEDPPDSVSPSATVTITITGSNDSVVAVDDTETTDEDTGITVNVLLNDTDLEDDPLSISGLDTSTLQGSLTSNGDGSFTYDPDGQFEDLDDGETAQDVFTYTVTDGTDTDSAQVTITITGISDTPPNLQVDVQPWDNPVLNGSLEGDDNLGTSLGEGLGEAFVFEGSGNAQIAGTGLGDEITGGPANDRLSGSDGDDIINGEGGIDRLAGGNGNDVLNGGENNDVLYGNNGNDQLVGGPGADLLDGGAGNDILTGNEGADLFIYDGRGDDVITDFMVGEDELQLPVGAEPEVEVTDAGTVLTFDDPLGSLTLAGVIVDLDML